jgi:MoaA/NifB/PqqE/SkfB family radical SAM enzyme
MDKRLHDSTKLLWHMDRVMKHFDRGERVAPIHIDMGLAKFCNIRCNFCFGKFQQIKKAYIKKDALLQTLIDANSIGVKSIAFIGDGEPTCNPYLYDALKLGREETRIDFAISTNGVLVDNEEKCHEILSTCKWMRFCFSAGTKAGYKSIHGVDRFDKVVDNIKRIVAVKKKHGYACEIGMQAVFVPTTMKEEMVEESKLAVSLGVDYFVVKQCSLPDDGESGMVNFDLDLYDAIQVKEALEECEKMATPETEIIVKWNAIKQKGTRPYKGCPSVPFISEMSGNGDWTICGYFFGDKPQFSKYKFGNVHGKSLKQIFESERYWKIIETMRNKFDSGKQCKGACRLDKTNEFCWNYLQRPVNENFI